MHQKIKLKYQSCDLVRLMKWICKFQLQLYVDVCYLQRIILFLAIVAGFCTSKTKFNISIVEGNFFAPKSEFIHNECTLNYNCVPWRIEQHIYLETMMNVRISVVLSGDVVHYYSSSSLCPSLFFDLSLANHIVHTYLRMHYGPTIIINIVTET